MAHTWANWKGKRSALFMSKDKTVKDQKKFEFKFKPNDKVKDICKRFNAGVCPKQSDPDCKTFFGNKLRHVCNKFTGNGNVCEKNHARKDHK